MTTVYVDNFDHDGDRAARLRGEKLDRHILATSKMVSVFWITETLARAKRVTKWEKSGQLLLDNKTRGFPWLVIAKCEWKAAASTKKDLQQSTTGGST